MTGFECQVNPIEFRYHRRHDCDSDASDKTWEDRVELLLITVDEAQKEEGRAECHHKYCNYVSI